ncbi:RDD family protein [Neobacillus sp. PS3-34]|uniref:RDD family protein n=1 Tax=Neobacillus sp. PS3-34 TaxID=3070678 RepID=UPI0027E10297|nr:RDD family protein [Neobacillus sp. PS3-34]WML48312.1 RDD family protein [Neobacillus sp. PS3-34]
MNKINDLDRFITAKVSKRIIAYMIDTLLIYLLVFFFRKAFLYNVAALDVEMQIKNSIINGILFSFYSIIFSNFIFKGQTIGKKIMKIHMICSNDERLDLMSLLNREILGKVFIEKINLWILLILLPTGLLDNLLININKSPMYFILWYLISLPWVMFLSFTMLVNSTKHLSLHDLVSKTKVVEKEH